MRMHNILVAALAAAGLAGCGATAQHPTTQIAKSDCAGLGNVDGHVAALYAPGAIQRVEPVYRQNYHHRDVQPREVSGASLYVAAQPGVSEAYLERVLSCHARAGADTHVGDPLRVAGVDDVDVASAGPSLRVAITGVDRSAADAILKRAKAMHRQGGDIQVQQLANAGTDRL